MTYEETTGRTIEADFKEFHEKNPIVYILFKKYVRQLVEARRGRGIPDKDIKISSKLIIRLDGINRLIRKVRDKQPIEEQ